MVSTPNARGASDHDRVVVFMLAHDRLGARGLVLNRHNLAASLKVMFESLGLPSRRVRDTEIRQGGMDMADRGFVLHTAEYKSNGTERICDDYALTTTTSILEDIAYNRGPDRFLLALGCTIWGPGQLDSELKDNLWLCVPANGEIIFGDDPETKWDRALRMIGANISQISSLPGQA